MDRISKLIEYFREFPGIGPRQAKRFVYFLFTRNASYLDELSRLILEIKKNIKFEKNLISRDSAKSIFKNQPYKLELLNEFYPSKIANKVSVYESGEFMDLCKGNHIKSTKEIPPDSFKLTKIAGAYWRGSEKNPMLTRIYGVAFSSKKELNDYLTMTAEAEKREMEKAKGLAFKG